MFLAILSVILYSIILCDAAPLTPGSISRRYSNGTVIGTPTRPTLPSTTGPAPADNSTIPSGEPLATIYPEYTSQYNARTGAVDFHTARGLVSRSPTNGGADITTLVTFALDAQAYNANTCQLVFDLSNNSSSSAAASGSLKAQIFTSLAPATASAETWPNGNLRDQELGSITVVAGGRAIWEHGSGPGASANGIFPCSAIAGELMGSEIVPQGDSVEISWVAGQDGLKILVF